MSQPFIRFSGRNAALYKQLLTIDPSIEGVLCGVGEALAAFDPKLFAEWGEEGLWPKVEAYALRYVLPLYALTGPSRDGLRDILAVQMLACVAWRHFDNCLDSHGSTIRTSLASSLSLLRLCEYLHWITSESIGEALKRHYIVMARQATIERTEPVGLTDIWMRCSIFLFSAETVAKLDNELLDIFRCYINYAGVAHDVHDYINDVTNGVKSLPVAWMDDLNPDGVFSVAAVKRLYDRLQERVATLEDCAKRMRIEQRFPLIAELWNESWRTIHHE
jgi:hypothetical protein